MKKIKNRTYPGAMTRREFVGRALAVGIISGAPAFLRGQNLNNKLNIAFIACGGRANASLAELTRSEEHTSELQSPCNLVCRIIDRKSTRLNSSHLVISYAVFCLKKKNIDRQITFMLFHQSYVRSSHAHTTSATRHSSNIYTA